MKIQIEITEQELKDLKAIRNYFGEHDKTMFEHKAYAVLDRLVKLLATPAVSESVQTVRGDLACKCGNKLFTHRYKNWIECTECNLIKVLQA
jgi:hypothetical protein